MLTSPPKHVLALDIGGTKVEASIGTLTGEVVFSHTEKTNAALGFSESWGAVLTSARSALEASARLRLELACAGISIGGPVSSEDGMVYSPPNLPGWDEVPLASMFSAEFGLPAFVEHDAKAGALAELRFGSGRGKQNLIFLTLGTGLGAGVIVDGRIAHGRRNNVGEVGHWRVAEDGPPRYGKPGSWEGYTSGAGVAYRAHAAAPDRWPEGTSAQEVFDAAREEDPIARAIVDDFANHLGKGIALMVDLLSPELVVLGSLAVRAGDLFLTQAQSIVDAECTARNLPCPIVATELGERIGTMAAMAIAVDKARELSLA